MKQGNVLIGLLAGVAAGAAIGVLIAPAKGSETRKKLAKNATDLKAKFAEWCESSMEQFESLKEDVLANVKSGKENIRKEDIKGS
jgi:gas vesicle protein